VGAHIDSARRDAMKAASAALRAPADDLIAKLQDPRLKDFTRRTVLFRLDDVDNFILGNPLKNPLSAAHEDTWLRMGDLLLSWARQGLDQMLDVVQKFGYDAKAIG
jgi:hypothetical protein